MLGSSQGLRLPSHAYAHTHVSVRKQALKHRRRDRAAAVLTCQLKILQQNGHCVFLHDRVLEGRGLEWGLILELKSTAVAMHHHPPTSFPFSISLLSVSPDVGV